MKYRVIFSPESRVQLIELQRYIAQEASPEIAQRFTAAIVGYCEGFDTFPYRGTKRDDIRPGLRTVGFRRRVTVAFAVDNQTVTILGVFYGGQDYETDLETEARQNGNPG